MKYVSWLEAVVVEGLTPGKLEEAATAEENRIPDEWEQRRHGPDCKCRQKTAGQIRKWAKTGLPRKTFDNLQEHIKLYAAHPDWKGYNVEESLVRSAREAVATIEQLSKKHEGHKNSVVLRKNWPGRLCQVCGVETKKGEMVVCGGRRRGEGSNRTGYAHLRCIKKLKIKKGEKLVHREVFIWGPGQWQGSTYVEQPPQKVRRGARLSRQQCINTGGQPTHMMWLGQSDAYEPVAFDRKSLVRKELGW